MSIKLRSGGIWKNTNKAYLRSGGVWKNITKAYIRSGGVWKSVFGFISSANDPSIAQTVTLVRSSSTMPATLTGTNYRWTNATVLTYKFQYYNGSQWLDGNGSNATGTISNPSVGSSTPKLYTPIIGDFPSSSVTSTGSFRFVVTATNTNVSPSLQTVSTSSTITIQNVVSPIIPTISMLDNSGVSQTEGTINWTSTNQNSWSSTGTFSGSGTNETSVFKSGLTAGNTYTGTVTVTSSTGNTASADYYLTASPAVNPPSNISEPVLSISSNNNMSVTSGEWTNSPTSYRYKWYQQDPYLPDPVRNVLISGTTDSFAGSYYRDYVVTVNAINDGGPSVQAAVSNAIVLEPPAEYSVLYDSNGGTGSPSGQTKTQDVTLTLSLTTPTRSGFTFNGWNTAANGTGTNYSAGGSYTANASVILYAKWAEVQYTVSWDPNGGTVSPTSNTVNAGVSVTAPTPTRSGFTFAYWRNPPPGIPVNPTIVLAGGSYTPTFNITFTAVWNTAISVPSGGSVSLTGSSTPGSVITASTSGWSGSPESYSVVIRTALFPTIPTATSDIVSFSVGGASECTYTISPSDAVSPVNIFKAFATATNSAGTSSVVSSGTISATPAASSPPASSPPASSPPASSPPASSPPASSPPSAPPSGCFDPPNECPSGTYWDCNACIG